MKIRERRSKSTPGVVGWLRGAFFAEEVPLGLALVRITLPLVLFYDLIHRWPFVRELYSADGATAPLWVTYGLRSPLPELPGAVAVALFTLLLTALLTASLGWMTRISLAVATVLYWYFTSLDAISTITKYTVIANHVLLLLTLSQCGAVWSLDALRRPVVGPRGGLRLGAVWPRRLIQLMVAVVYLGAAMTKIHTPSYFNGDQMMWWMLTHVNAPHPVGEWMANRPVLLSVGAYATIIWEVLFLFLIWHGIRKYLMLLIGVGFHVGTYLTLGLDIFPCVMITIYFAFLDDREILRCIGWVRDGMSRLRLPSVDFRAAAARFAPAARQLGPVAFGLFVWGVALGGAGLERVMDPYGVRGPDGPMELKKVDRSVAARMLSGSRPLRLKDMLFGLELGTDYFGDSLIGRKTTFAQGETLIAQCMTAPPHPDMYVECNLFTAQGRILERQGLVLTRDSNRLNFALAFSTHVSRSAGRARRSRPSSISLSMPFWPEGNRGRSVKSSGR